MPASATFNERLTIAIDSRRLDGLRSVAKREELSIGAVVRRLIRELLEREGEPAPEPQDGKGGGVEKP